MFKGATGRARVDCAAAFDFDRGMRTANVWLMDEQQVGRNDPPYTTMIFRHAFWSGLIVLFVVCLATICTSAYNLTYTTKGQDIIYLSKGAIIWFRPDPKLRKTWAQFDQFFANSGEVGTLKVAPSFSCVWPHHERYTIGMSRIIIPLWIPSLILGTGLTFPLMSFARGLYRRRKGLCVRCAYVLTGNVSGVCPECGTKVSV